MSEGEFYCFDDIKAEADILSCKIEVSEEETITVQHVNLLESRGPKP